MTTYHDPLTEDEAILLCERIYGTYVPGDEPTLDELKHFLDLDKLIQFVESADLLKSDGRGKVDWSSQWRELLKMRLRGWSGHLVAEWYGISYQRVYQVERRILRMMRHPIRRKLWERRDS